uniref:NADH-ubiquinone oxidoreductase chain 2 n=1 Tax=Libiocoris heissi TaxID=1176477 RepID=A0A172DYW0_9HEMI|nr:NADH dehydrogenase subunit 2 [Libiocoris heissi]AFI54708.1 NADH dehydrogenase subunit 2 [Libiocoris heissi]
MMKYLMYTVMMMGTMMVTSSNNWITMWMGLEINMMSFVPMMKSKSMESSKSMMMYFLMQSLGSMMMMISLLINSSILLTPDSMETMVNSLIIISMMIKMGLPPMQTWMIKTMQSMNWTPCLILMSWQKIAPLTIINQTINNQLTTIIIVTASFTGAMGGINQTCLRTIMAYSSISHMSWMMLLTCNSKLWITYMMIYLIMMTTICKMMKSENIFYLNQFNSLNHNNKMTFTLNMMSMGGMPPMIGFIPKWITIQSAVTTNNIPIITMMSILSLITLMYYMNMISPYLMKSSLTTKMQMKKSHKTSTTMLVMMLPTLMMLSLT